MNKRETRKLIKQITKLIDENVKKLDSDREKMHFLIDVLYETRAREIRVRGRVLKKAAKDRERLAA